MYFRLPLTRGGIVSFSVAELQAVEKHAEDLKITLRNGRYFYTVGQDQFDKLCTVLNNKGQSLETR